MASLLSTVRPLGCTRANTYRSRNACSKLWQSHAGLGPIGACQGMLPMTSHTVTIVPAAFSSLDMPSSALSAAAMATSVMVTSG